MGEGKRVRREGKIDRRWCAASDGGEGTEKKREEVNREREAAGEREREVDFE